MSVIARVTQPLQHYWKRYRALAWVVPLLWLLTIAAITLVWHVGSIGLIDETEPLFVEASRQMVLTGDWITPYFDGETRFDKPPLIYWLMVIAFQTFGINEFAARLPSVLAALAIVLFCFYTLQRYEDDKRQTVENENQLTPNSSVHETDAASATQEIPTTNQPLTTNAPLLSPPQSGNKLHSSPRYLAAYLGATMLLLNPNTFFWGRTGYSDMLLNACMGGSLLAFFWVMLSPIDR